MYKKQFLFYLFIIISFITLGQNNDSLQTYLINYNKVKFITTDSIYNFTLFIEPNGKFYFANGFIDSSYEKESYRFYNFEKKEKLKECVYKYKYLKSTTDTIYSYYPISPKNNLDEKTIYQILNISYILKKFGEPRTHKTKDTIIKILYPYDELNFSYCYHLITIKLSKQNTKMYAFLGCFKNVNDIHILKNDSCTLKTKHIKNINKQLNNINSLKTNIFVKNNNAWFMTYHTSTYDKYFIVSNDYSNDENLKAIKLAAYSIIKTSKIYFKHNFKLN